MRKYASLVVLTSIATLVHSLWAQSDPTCQTLWADLAAQVNETCAVVADGQACYGAGVVSAESAEGSLAQPADTINLASVTNLTVSPNDDGLSVASLTIPTQTPDSPIRLTLFGDASIENKLGRPVEVVELPVSNAVGYDVNLRAGPGTEFDVAGAFGFSAEGVATARTEDNQWLQVDLGDTVAWVSTTFARVDGDINTLPTGDNPYTQPMQALSLSSAANVEGCGAGSAGLLIQYAGQDEAALQINGADIRLEAGVFLAQADEAGLTLFALKGSLEVSSAGEEVALQAGQSADIALESDVPSAPTLLSAYPFAEVEGLPTALLPQDQVVCVGGVASEVTSSLSEPKADSANFEDVSAAGNVVITGWAEDESGARWWRLQDTSWLPAESVQTTAFCETVGEVEAVAARIPTGGNGGSGVDVATILSQRSIWEANSGVEVSTGSCNFPPVAMCQHLVAISDNGDGSISWRGQELQPYPLFSSGENFFSFSGRNQLNNANISLALTFNSESTWTMTMTTVFDNDPQCIRTFNYRATRSR